MPKPPSQVAAAIEKHKESKAPPTQQQVTQLQKELAGKPYGSVKEVEKKVQNISVSLPPTMVDKLQDTARANKRGGDELTTVSAIVRDALEKAGY